MNNKYYRERTSTNYQKNDKQNPYFVAIDGNNSRAQLIDEALEPFRLYLSNAINAVKEKEVSCRWEKVETPGFILQPQQNIYRVVPQCDIEISLPEPGWFEITRDLDDDIPLDQHFDPDIEDPVIIGKGKNRKKLNLKKEDYKKEISRYIIHLGNIETDRINWTGYNLEVKQLSPVLDEKIIFKQNDLPFTAIKLESGYYRVKGFLKSSEPIQINDTFFEFRFEKYFDHKNSSIELHQDGNEYLCFTKKKPKIENSIITDISKDWLTKLSLSALSSDQGPMANGRWELQLKENQWLLIPVSDEKTPTEVCHLKYPDLKFHFEKNKNEKWIQLIGDEQNDDDGITRDALEYFFDDSIRIQNQSTSKNIYKEDYVILKSRFEDRQLMLGNKRGGNSVYPKDPYLKLRVDFIVLKRQKNSVKKLKEKPAKSLKPLLDLMHPRDKHKWPDFKPVPIDDSNWEVLTNPEFDGCDKQREFVAKAMATPDFAILDGPPGTGKTTTILELIVQLVREGKRVLLAASTHAAINNVLERVKENKLENEVFPIRIGDENRAIGVEEFQFDKLAENLKGDVSIDKIEQIMVDSSNLVCGTTIGILRLFDNKNIKLDRGEPPFDVMIIDECSKTTFSEFLVPALYAKRWILVGDIKQLSPFTDRDQITANLKSLVLKGGKNPKHLSGEVQQASFLLNALWPFKEKFAVPVSNKILQALSDELVARLERNSDNNYRSIAVVSKLKDGKHFINEKDLINEPWQLYNYNVLFIDENLYQKYINWIPADSICLDKDWHNSSHGFRHFSKWDGKHIYRHKGRQEQTNEAKTIFQLLTEHFKKSSWADEIVWRLEREYWLRFLNNSKQGKKNKAVGIRKQLDRLFPFSTEATGRIYQLRNMVFPSILEGLSGSGLIKSKSDNPNTLNQGFKKNEKACRYTTLTHQHRMHPDISNYSRKQFYTTQGMPASLIDGSFVRESRNWRYNVYPKRAVWLNVNGSVYKNRNEKEADYIIKELKTFCKWAEAELNTDGNTYDVAILTFYKGQEALLREKLRKFTGRERAYSRFEYNRISIKLATVDFFQGQEADLVFLSMVNTNRDGFLDSPNRLNVSVTRARYQLVVVGHNNYFNRKSKTPELNKLAKMLEMI